MTIYTNIKTMSPAEYKKARQDAVLGKLTLKPGAKKAPSSGSSDPDASPKGPAIKPANRDAEDNRTVRYALKKMAREAGIIDVNDLSLNDISSVTVNDKDEIEGGEEYIAALKEAKPHFFKKD